MAQHGFRLFKWTIHGLLALNVRFFLRTEETLTALIDSAARIALPGVMEYESTTLDKPYSGPWEKRILAAIPGLAYAFIISAWSGYIVEREWRDVINATAWLVCFAVIELNVFGFEQACDKARAHGASQDG